MNIDPLALFASDREQARTQNDPMVDRCIVGTINRQGGVSQRTLVLRDIDDRLALFYSEASPKHLEFLSNDNEASLLTLFPSVGVQYRLSARLIEMPRSIVESHWQLKPGSAKRLDAIYSRFLQSTVISDIEQFETRFAATVAPVKAPLICTGCFIEPFEIERLLLRSDPHRHDRKRFVLHDSEWTEFELIP